MRWGSLSSSPRRVGLLTGGVIALVVAATLAWPMLSIGDREYTAQFERAAGLKLDDEVRIAGIGVGKVRAVELAGDHVDVRFTIDDQVKLGTDTRAEVKLGTLLGSTFLDLEPGGSGDLADGVIPLRNTHTTFQIQEVVEGAQRSTAQLDADAVRRALRAVTNALPEDSKTMSSTLDGLSRLAEVVSSRDAEMERLLLSATAVAKLLSTHGNEVTELMREADALLRVILERKQAVHDILNHVEGMSRNLSGLIKENRADVKPLLDRLFQVTTVLKRRNAALDEGLRILGPASRYLSNATGNGPYIDLGGRYPAPDNVLCAAGIVEGCR